MSDSVSDNDNEWSDNDNDSESDEFEFDKENKLRSKKVRKTKRKQRQKNKTFKELVAQEHGNKEEVSNPPPKEEVTDCQTTITKESFSCYPSYPTGLRHHPEALMKMRSPRQLNFEF